MTLEWGLIRRPPCRRIESRRLGPFQTVALVAQGRRTDALLARHDEADGPWLLRVLHPDQDRRSFARELDHSAAFDGAARVEGAAEYDGVLVAHVRPVVGETLATILGHLFETRSSLPAELAINLISGIASRFPGPPKPHGDIVPHHVLVGYDGYVHVIDPAAPEVLADRAQAPGRAGYRSPEHVAGQPLSPASDVFSLGLLLFELTTGHRLFEGDDATRAGREILSGEYKRPRSVVESYPIELQVVLRRMLRPIAADRFSDPAAAAEALRRTSERARGAGPALGQWLAERFPDRREAWQVGLRAAGFELPSAPVRDVTVPRPAPRPSPAASTRAATPPPVSRAAPIAGPPPNSAPAARPVPAAPITAPSLTLEELEQADAEGRSLFNSPPMDFGGSGAGEITAPSRVGPPPDKPPSAPRAQPLAAIALAPAPRSDTLLDPEPRTGSEPTAIVEAHPPARPPERPAPAPAPRPAPSAPPRPAPSAPPRPAPIAPSRVAPSRPPPGEAPPRPVPKTSRPPDGARPKASMDLASDLLEEWGNAPPTDRAPVPASMPPETVDSVDLEIRVDFANEPSSEVSIPSPRRIHRAPSMGPEEATAQLDMSRLRSADDRADTAIEAPSGVGARPVPPRKEATMVVRDRGPKSRPEAGANPLPPPAPKPSDVPPPPKPSDGPPAAAHKPSTPAGPRGLEPLEALEAIAARSSAAPVGRRSSSIGPLPKRPAVERSVPPPADPAPSRRRPPRDPTSEHEQLVIPVVEEESPERKRRALVLVVVVLIAIGAAGGVGVARFFPELVPRGLRGHLGPLEAPRAAPAIEKPSGGDGVPATTITSSAAGLMEEEELPPLLPLVPDPNRPAGQPSAAEIPVRLVIFPARARITLDGVRVLNGATVALGPSPRKIELKARGCTPYSGSVDSSVGESFEMVLPCKDLSRP